MIININKTKTHTNKRLKAINDQEPIQPEPKSFPQNGINEE